MSMGVFLHPEQVLGLLPSWRCLLFVIAVLEVFSAVLVLSLHETPKWITEKSPSVLSVLEKLIKAIAKANGKSEAECNDLVQFQTTHHKKSSRDVVAQARWPVARKHIIIKTETNTYIERERERKAVADRSLVAAC